MVGVTAEERVEHTAVINGFIAQIARLERKEGELFARLVASAERSKTVEAFEQLTVVRKQTQALKQQKEVRKPSAWQGFC